MAKIELQRTTPEAQGISSSAVLNFVNRIEQDIQELHSFMLLRHGAVAAEGWWSPYRPERPHMLFSLSKSFTSSAIGLAVAEGRLSVEDAVVSFFPKETPKEIGPNLAAMRIRHLLSMSTGHAEDSLGRVARQRSRNWVKNFLSLAVEHEPGAHFVYNSGATYMLSAILQKVTGQKLLDYLTPRLFEPLGIQDAAWEVCPLGINTGGWGLSIKTEDIARFGQMYLQDGAWNGQQILPAAWVLDATTKHISNGSKPDSDWEQGYGYQFWRCQHNAYRGDGAFGQYCVVMPEQDAVLAITSGVVDMQSVLTLVWEKLLPACGPAALPADPAAHTALQDKLAALALAAQQGQSAAPAGMQVFSGRTARLQANPLKIKSACVTFNEEGGRLAVQRADGEQSVAFWNGQGLEGTTDLYKAFPWQGSQKCASSGCWTAADTLTITVRLFETPFYHSLACQFTPDGLQVTDTVNVGFDPERTVQLSGKWQK